MYGGPGLTDEFLDPQVKGASVPNAFVSHEGQPQFLCTVMNVYFFIFLHTSEIIHKLWCILSSAFKIINNDNNNELHYDINLVTLYFKMSATRYMYLLL